MFSKNIILLLCVVCFIVKSSATDKEKKKWFSLPFFREKKINHIAEEASTVGVIDERPVKSNKFEGVKVCSDAQKKLVELTTDQWQNIFETYDTNNIGSLSLEEFQKLVFENFRGFLTIREARCYAHAINTNKPKKCEIGLKQLENLKPMIFVLSQRENIEKDEQVDSISSETFINEIMEKFKNLFNDKEEVLEVLKLFDQNENSPIERAMYEEILQMLTASKRMLRIHGSFCLMDEDHNGVFDADELKAWMNEYTESATKGSATEQSATEKAAAEKLFTKTFKKLDLNDDGFIDFNEYMIMAIKDIKPLYSQLKRISI
ncbi:uncharacterized protein LOC126838534 [Adelges cooleyi]|uniref:uncharacterized protein LOC126838534 n=1 Tax=Adelges cooleyi TaxID=133065 RepID=UPI0021800010|nr:uncharacterized protein LOC126838534 [Adelges cooleyi]XP_050428992.1 uncharacterized protein LOC126838534 [Adelges cooleyi]